MYDDMVPMYIIICTRIKCIICDICRIKLVLLFDRLRRQHYFLAYFLFHSVLPHFIASGFRYVPVGI